MRRIIDNDYLTLFSRLFIGGIFIYAAYTKIIDPAGFAKSIWFYHIVPGKLINLMAIVIPWLEMLCGVGLILGFFYKGSVFWVNMLLLVFMAALSTAIARGISIDCGCFKASAASSDSAREALFRDIGFLVLSLQLLFSRCRKWMIDG